MVDMSSLKNCWKSVTIWFNGVCLALLPTIDFLKDNVPAMQEYVDATAYKWVMGGIVLANILLRFKTTTGLAQK
jgi:hypothetical protein